jgi:hypothetical protein
MRNAGWDVQKIVDQVAPNQRPDVRAKMRARYLAEHAAPRCHRCHRELERKRGHAPRLCLRCRRKA